MSERDEMSYDVLIVGAGPAGLAAALFPNFIYWTGTVGVDTLTIVMISGIRKLTIISRLPQRPRPAPASARRR